MERDRCRIYMIGSEVGYSGCEKRRYISGNIYSTNRISQKRLNFQSK